MPWGAPTPRRRSPGRSIRGADPAPYTAGGAPRRCDNPARRSRSPHRKTVTPRAKAPFVPASRPSHRMPAAARAVAFVTRVARRLSGVGLVRTAAALSFTMVLGIVPSSSSRSCTSRAIRCSSGGSRRSRASCSRTCCPVRHHGRPYLEGFTRGGDCRGRHRVRRRDRGAADRDGRARDQRDLPGARAALARPARAGLRARRAVRRAGDRGRRPHDAVADRALARGGTVREGAWRWSNCRWRSGSPRSCSRRCT